MRDEKKKTESTNKVVVFDIDEKILTDAAIDRVLTESLTKEADELEEELNQNPSLKEADVSDDMFQSIVRQLKEEGLWEEDENTEVEKSSAKDTKDTEDAERVEEEKQRDALEMRGQREKDDSQDQELEKLYAMLPEADRRALKLGKQIEKENEVRAARKRKRRKVFKYSGIAAAVLVLVFGGSMSIEANRRLVLKVWDGVKANLGFRMATNYSGEEELVRGKSRDEIEAMEKISNELGISAITLEYMPVNMKYQRYEIMGDDSEAVTFYTYQERIFSVTMINRNREGVSYYALDNEAVLRDTVVNDQKIEAKIWEVNLDKDEETYVAEIDYNDCRYILNGMISFEEIKKIAKNVVIL